MKFFLPHEIDNIDDIKTLSNFIHNNVDSMIREDWHGMQRELTQAAESLLGKAIVALLNDPHVYIEKTHNKINVIKMIQFLTNRSVGLKNAKDVVDVIFEVRERRFNNDKVPF